MTAPAPDPMFEGWDELDWRNAASAASNGG